MPNPINLGGADIYLPEKKGFFAKLKAKRALNYHKEGDMNVINYNGMTVKYPDQTNVKLGKSTMPAKIYTYEGRTEFVLNGAEVKGSDADDNVAIYCTNSVFDFEGGGVDTIHLTKKQALEGDSYKLGNSVTIGDGDHLIDNVDYTYNDVTIISETTHYVRQGDEISVEEADMEYLDCEVDEKTVRIKNGELYLDEELWDANFEEE